MHSTLVGNLLQRAARRARPAGRQALLVKERLDEDVSVASETLGAIDDVTSQGEAQVDGDRAPV
jgi:hypothetical protein